MSTNNVNPTLDSDLLADPSPIHLEPSGEPLADATGLAGGLHFGPAGGRLPGSDPLYDGSLLNRVIKDSNA